MVEHGTYTVVPLRLMLKYLPKFVELSAALLIVFVPVPIAEAVWSILNVSICAVPMTSTPELFITILCDPLTLIEMLLNVSLALLIPSKSKVLPKI